MATKSAQSEIWYKRMDRWKKISTIPPKDIFEICQKYLAESADAMLGRPRKKYPPSTKIPSEKESQFFPLIWAAEIRGMPAEASHIERSILPMMSRVGNERVLKESELYKIIIEGEIAVKNLRRRIQLEICEKDELKNKQMLTMAQRMKLWLIEFAKTIYQLTIKSFFDSVFGK
jgi:hypothetical protein